MRKALNDNPALQIVIVGVLLAVAALFLMMQGGGSGSQPSSQAAQPSMTPTTSVPATGVGTPVTSVGGASGGSLSSFQAGSALPGRVLASYRSGNIVVVLVVRPGGADDELVRAAVERLRSQAGVSVFVTDVNHVASYAAITEGVSIDRAPALIVISPGGGGTPRASVSYGFQSASSVDQAVRDAAYKGAQTTSYAP